MSNTIIYGFTPYVWQYIHINILLEDKCIPLYTYMYQIVITFHKIFNNIDLNPNHGSQPNLEAK
jgi:hypothetical protein